MSVVLYVCVSVCPTHQVHNTRGITIPTGSSTQSIPALGGPPAFPTTGMFPPGIALQEAMSWAVRVPDCHSMGLETQGASDLWCDNLVPRLHSAAFYSHRVKKKSRSASDKGWGGGLGMRLLL